LVVEALPLSGNVRVSNLKFATFISFTSELEMKHFLILGAITLATTVSALAASDAIGERQKLM